VCNIGSVTKHQFMSTRSRIGIELEDGSIKSVYHHFDGYPEGLGVKLLQHYTTEESVNKLIDGGNMSNCWSDSRFDVKTGKFYPIADPKPTYYGGDNERPIISKYRKDFFMIDSWQEYSYIFVPNGRGQGFWAMYETNQTFDENYDKVLSYEVTSCNRRAYDQMIKEDQEVTV